MQSATTVNIFSSCSEVLRVGLNDVKQLLLVLKKESWV